MGYLGWAWNAFRIFVVLWVASFFVRHRLPEEWRNSFEKFDIFLVDTVVSIPLTLTRIWLLTATILYFVGNFFVLMLLAFGVFMLVYSLHEHLSQMEFTLSWWFQLSNQLVSDKAAWSGATMIVAATVAIANMWKINLDKKQYFEKKEKENIERRKEQEKQHLERIKRKGVFDVD